MTNQQQTEKLSPELRAKINKYSSQKGGSYERHVAKVISSYHGIDWKDGFLRTKRTTGGQPKGDIYPIGDMTNLWRSAGLGSIECKNRNTEWSFDELFRRPETCYLFKYWEKSAKDTTDSNTIVIFTKNGVTDYVLFVDDAVPTSAPHILFIANSISFKIMTLLDFLKYKWKI
jgi:hypothetical protein